MSARSAHNWKTGPLPSQTKKSRRWRTRSPVRRVWEADIVPPLARDVGGLEVATIVGEVGGVSASASTSVPACMDALTDARGERADMDHVRILHSAASTLESRVEVALEELVSGPAGFDYAAV
jgi:hypothetical protein